jgi:hypothetical protein
MSANVSNTLSHLDLPLVISQAIGMTAMRSRAETMRPIVKEFVIAPKAWFMSLGWARTVWIVLHFVKIPTIGGKSIIPRKIMTAKKYRAYFRVFFVARAFRVSRSLGCTHPAPYRIGLLIR